MPLQATSGAASYDAFGGGVPVVPNYIEEVFSCFLYEGNNSVNTITNNIDLSTKGGLVWIKGRIPTTSVPTFDNILYDTARGEFKTLRSNTTGAEGLAFTGLTSFTSTGFVLGSASQTNIGSGAGNIGQYVSWTFREQPKFFDVVTYSGTGANRTISHSLGSVPACIMVKRTDATGDWQVYHRSLANTEYLVLNSDAAKATGATRWNSTTPTSAEFSLGTDATVNASAGTYVAYLFAHDAGGFGLTGTDNVISCGSFDANLGEVINLGYEPQWLLYKASADVDNWRIADNMRGLTNLSGTNAYTIQQLRPNSSAVESENSGPVLTSTGFTWNQSGGGVKHIYIAIRRGPMKVPTSGTSVFSPIARTGTGATATVTGVGFPPDLFIGQIRGTAGYWNGLVDRLRGVNKRLVTSQTNAEDTTSDAVTSFTMDGVTLGADSNGFVNESGKTYIEWNFKRAPSFFDEVCYTGDGGNPQVVTHNLTVVPEMIFVKARSIGYQWISYHSALGTGSFMELNSTAASVAYAAFPSVSATTFSADSSYNRASGQTFVAYLFATCLGVSKVFSYTGNGSSQTINCGFTGGARFILIKRTDDVGDWYVWDTARGIVAGNDPYLRLNSTAAEVTSNDTIDTDSTGFVVNQVSATNVNVSSATYIGLAIA